MGITGFAVYSVVEGAKSKVMLAEFPDFRVKEQDDEGTRIDLDKAKL